MPVLPLRKPLKPTAIGVSVFAGGFSLGVSKHFKVLCHLEESRYGVETAQQNLHVPVYIESPAEHCGITNEIPDLHGIPDLLFGNPPCAAWSTAAYSKVQSTERWKTSEKVDCTRRFFSLLEKWQPTFWAWESVVQAYTQGCEFVCELAQKASRLGYSTSIILHDSKWLGVPQSRKRFFMVCHKIHFLVGPINFNNKPKTCGEALSRIKPGESCYGNRANNGCVSSLTPQVLAKIPAGQWLNKWWDEHCKPTDPAALTKIQLPGGGLRGRPPFGCVRLRADRPAPAITGYGMVHPVDHRFLSTEELQALCGFPSTWHFSPREAYARAGEIARGVCPPVAAWLADQISWALHEDESFQQPTVTLYDIRRPGIPPQDLTSWLD